MSQDDDFDNFTIMLMIVMIKLMQLDDTVGECVYTTICSFFLMVQLVCVYTIAGSVS